jgi:acetyl esterase/lipase
MSRARVVIRSIHSNLIEREEFLMSSSESIRIRSYLLASQAAQQNAPQPSLAELRANYEMLLENYVGHPVSLPEGVYIEAVDMDGLPAEWIRPPDADAERVVLYVHGGGYVLGSLKSHRNLVAHLATASGVRHLLFEYRRAPEHVFPAALDDVLTAYRWLLSNGTKPAHIVLAGDSAGGGLILALLQILRDGNIAMPAGAALLSPWTDLVGTVESRTTREAADPVFSAQTVDFLASFYPGSEDKHHPLISPMYADLSGFPPLRIDVGRDEVLLDDSLQVAEHARAAHVPTELVVWDDMWHVFQQYAPALPEGLQSLEQIGRFIRRQTQLA